MSQHVNQEFDDATCCKLIEELVAIESFSGNEATASKFLVGQFERLGYDKAFVDSAGNAVGIRGRDGSEITIILLGHIDTVPGEIPVRVEDGILKVSYDQYEKFGGKFGHLFYKDTFSHYRLRLEYRFVGEQAP